LSSSPLQIIYSSVQDAGGLVSSMSTISSVHAPYMFSLAFLENDVHGSIHQKRSDVKYRETCWII